MLPSYSICRKHIVEYNKLPPAPKGKVGFRIFWKCKQELENKGGSILAEDNLQETASNLRKFLIFWKMSITGVAKVDEIKQILRKIKPYYNQIRDVELGNGQMRHCRPQIEAIYEKLGGITDNVNYTGSESSIVGKSKTLLAIWGQTPGFDSLNRKRFVKWTHPPEPLKLPHLRSSEIWYKPTQFCDMIMELDDWVLRWRGSNNGKIFANSFSDLCPGLPVGRIIDMIYNWKLPDSRVDSVRQ